MAAIKTKKAGKDSQANACEALVAMRPRAFDRKSIAAIVGERTVATMPLVAKEFGVRAATIRQSWRPNGMPGENGKYSLAAITLWKLQLDRENEKHTKSRGVVGGTLQEIAIEDARVSLAIKKAKYQENEGQLVPLEEIRAELYAMLAVFTKTLLEIPRSLLPMLPEKIAAAVVAEVEKLIRHALSALSEKSHKIYMKEGSDGEDSQL